MRDYQLISPSLEGIIRHNSVTYEGIKRPEEVLRIMDGPIARGRGKQGDSHDDAGPESGYTEHQQKIIEQYFHDLYGVFMKKLAYFVVESSYESDLPLKLQAMLQELIKIKTLMDRSGHIHA